MDDESIRDELRKISAVMGNFSLGTVKIAKIQADLCDVKKENTTLKEKVSSLEQETIILKEENTILKGELSILKNDNTMLKGELSTVKNDNIILKGDISTLKKENIILKGLNKTVLEKISNLGKENTVLKNSLDTLRNEVEMLKSTFMSKGKNFYEFSESRNIFIMNVLILDSVGQCSNERESDFASAKIELADVDVNLADETNEPDQAEEEIKLTDGKSPNIGKKPKTQRKREQVN